MTTDYQHERYTDYITHVFDKEEPEMVALDQQPEVETAREPVNTETRIDRNAAYRLIAAIAHDSEVMKAMSPTQRGLLRAAYEEAGCPI